MEDMAMAMALRYADAGCLAFQSRRLMHAHSLSSSAKYVSAATGTAPTSVSEDALNRLSELVYVYADSLLAGLLEDPDEGGGDIRGPVFSA
ncbi:hypothetical protein FB645_002951 [Coemansia sp. IMI 203386]|nr:hypothetical protein FB645_002951 [Coemansia sp. IMI 203386]